MFEMRCVQRRPWIQKKVKIAVGTAITGHETGAKPESRSAGVRFLSALETHEAKLLA